MIYKYYLKILMIFKDKESEETGEYPAKKI
jgi:hypothetical protein